MFAIVSIAGQQFRVSTGQEIFVHRLNAETGESVSFQDVLLIDQGGDLKVGTPTIPNASVKVKVLAHVKGDKVLVFKKKRRKGYKLKNGHRQSFTKVAVESIS